MRRLLGIALATLTLVASAYADIIFSAGNNISSPFQNVLVGIETGTTIRGTTNTTGDAVLFSSATDTLIGTSGHASIVAMDGFINNVAITVPGHTFSEILVNPQNPVTAMGLAVTATTSDGKTFDLPAFGTTTGNNFLTISTTGGEMISSIVINSTGGFVTLGQTRFTAAPGGITEIPEPPTEIPEPGTFGLLGTGLIGLTGVVRRNLKLGT